MHIAIVAGALLATVQIAAAQPDDEVPPVEVPPVEARPVEAPPPAVTLFMEGRTLLEAGKAAEACSKFEESFKLDARAAGTMLNLGLCHEAIGKLATAIMWFRRAQTSAAETNLTETENAAKERSQALASRIATIKLQITAPAGAAVTLDGTRIDEVNYGRLEIDAGRHALELTAPNVPPVKKEIEVVDGQATTVVLELEPPRKEKKYVLVDVGKPARRASKIYLGAGIGLIATSAVVGGVGRLLHDGGERPDDFALWKNVVRYGGTSLFVAGVAAATYAVILRVRAPDMERREVVTPVITRDQVGFAFAKTF